MAIQWTGIKRTNEETAPKDDITPVENSGVPGDVVVGESTVFVKTTMYGDKWLTRFNVLPEYNDPFKRGYIPWSSNDHVPKFIERFLFSNETAAAYVTMATPEGYLVVPHAASSSKIGYVSGGYSYNTSSGISTIKKTEFAVETDFTVTANLTVDPWQSTGPCSSQRGYRCGGFATGGLTSTCDYIDFANDTTNAVAINNMDAEVELASAFNSTTKGYLFGGLGLKSGGGYESISTIRRLEFSTGSQFAAIAETTKHITYWYSTANSRNRGYQVRGYNYGVGYVNYYFRFAFATETTTTDAMTGYMTQGKGTTNTHVALYNHGRDSREKMFFGTDTTVTVCARYAPPSQLESGGAPAVALDTTDNNGFIFAN